jgi:hypothetical protein
MSSRFELPIFPLNTVLFPGGVLPLKIFEQRYMAMARDCLRDETPFGVCLIAQGSEVGAPALPHAVGSSARIAEWDMPQLGVLRVTARGGPRFRILEREADRGGLIRARVQWLAEETVQPVPPERAGLVPLLQAIVAEAGEERIPRPHAFDDAAWVGCRLSEVLPIPLAARQRLLELDDSLSRLEIIQAFLQQKGVL